MAFKFVAFFACMAVASAGYLTQVATPLTAVAQPVLAKTEAHDPNPQYSFGYDVQDAISGDNKNQVESRNGDVVQGQYSLNDADGYRRIVDYSADPLNGFNAVVRREPLGAAVAVKTVAAAPKLIKAAPASVAYAAAPRLIQTPTLIKSAPAQLTYAAPAQTLLRAAPAPFAYAAAPSLIHGAPTLSYASAAPALLRSQTLIKSSPLVSYSSAPTLLKSYAAAPALTYGAGGSTLVKTSFASPIVSYAY